MRKIQIMSRKTLSDEIANSVLRERTDVEDIDKHFRKHRLRWLGHIEPMNVECLTRLLREKTIGGKC